LFSLSLPSLLPPLTQHQERAAEIAQQVSQTGQLHRKSSQALASHIHHLCLQVGVVDHQFPEDCEIFFFLYDHARKWSTSERYMMQVAKSTDKSRSHDQKKHTVVFTVREDIWPVMVVCCRMNFQSEALQCCIESGWGTSGRAVAI